MSEAKSYQKYLDSMNNIQENILHFLEDEAESENNFVNIENIFSDTGIKDNKLELLSLLHLISKIANNCHHFHHFYINIEKILQYFKNDFKKYFSNLQIFNIFKSNKKILLFLIEEKIMIFDEYIVKKITKSDKFIMAKYPQYFQPEIQPFINEKWFPKFLYEDMKKELPEFFNEKRKIGENDDPLSAVIREDIVDEFVSIITQGNIPYDTIIKPSIYETNPFLLEKPNQKLTLIEYAVFFGSIQIYTFLRIQKVKLTQSLWLLAIHGKNADIIHSLEENHVKMDDNTYMQCFYEALKCHHNDIANYFLNNFLHEEEGNSQNAFYLILKYYNFAFLEDELINESSFYNLCKYDYCILVDSILESKEIDINKMEIFRLFVNQISYNNIFILF